MKLYYDNLLAYMPTAIIDENSTEPTKPDENLLALRNVMFGLASFQTTQNTRFLYNAVYQISLFAKVSITDLLFDLGDVEITSGGLDYLLDTEARKVFDTAVSGKFEEFDYKYCASILLSAAHALWELQRNAELNPPTEPVAEEQRSEDTTQT